MTDSEYWEARREMQIEGFKQKFLDKLPSEKLIMFALSQILWNTANLIRQPGSMVDFSDEALARTLRERGEK